MEGKELSINESFMAIEDTITKLENEEISLEDAFEIYKKGMDLVKQCSDKIDKVEKKVLSLRENGEVNEFE